MGCHSEPNREPGYRYHHGRRVETIALEIAQFENLLKCVNVKALRAASLLHDLGKCLPNANGQDHALKGANETRRRLQNQIDQETLNIITEAIAQHNKRRSDLYPSRHEETLIQDADLIDHFGLMEVWLHFYQIAKQNGTIKDAVALPYQEHLQSWHGYAQGSLNYPTSQSMLHARMARSRDFFTLFAQEQRGRIE